ncbi:MAG: hydrolase, partial [Bacteroidetes bacterium]|nr:hydrolase [Bacteroidota bacterium]
LPICLNSTWDVKWQAESRIYEDHYIMEIAIPFSSIKFREGDTKWRFQAYRFDFQGNERSAWARIPQNQIMLNLAFMGELVFEKPLGKSRTPIAIIPYVNTGYGKDYITGETDKDLGFGGDAKVAIGNGMNLDLTLNPDFSNVEADPIFTNLTRFEISLPERRQFFVDNSDLFASFGSSRDAIPFFSRRIGIARDTTNTYIENRILGGVRLSGKLNQNWRLGFLNIQTEEDLPNKIPSNNNMMLALQKKVFSRSNIGFFLVNRQSFKEYNFLENENTYDKYNRVVGVDYNLASADNTWSGKFYLHRSLQPDDSKGNYSSQALLIYNTRFYRIISDFVYVDQEFQSDLGFIPRTDVFKTGHAVERIFWPKKGIMNRHSFQLFSLNFWRPNLGFKKTDHDYQVSWRAEFKDQSNFRLNYSNKFIFLTRNFDPTRSREGVPLPGSKGYYFNQVSAEYQSNRADVLSYEIESTVGEFYNGNSFSFEGILNFRLQPWAAIGFALNYDQIRLPDPHPDADLWLLSPKIDITFSRSLFWSTLVQYSNQRDNLGLNSRLQWRYAPLSDLYLVYNDNYFVNHFGPRFRSINLKLSYWLNI